MPGHRSHHGSWKRFCPKEWYLALSHYDFARRGKVEASLSHLAKDAKELKLSYSLSILDTAVDHVDLC